MIDDLKVISILTKKNIIVKNKRNISLKFYYHSLVSSVLKLNINRKTFFEIIPLLSKG